MAQEKIIKKIAEKGSCVIVGRAADYILKDNPNLVSIFISAPLSYRVNKIMDMYHDSKEKAEKHIISSDKNRASYYEMISGQEWGQAQNYDLCIDSSIGKEKTALFIVVQDEKKTYHSLVTILLKQCYETLIRVIE